jgi:hypothetical protein
LSNLQFILAVLAIAFIAVLALVSLVDLRRRRTPPFLNYFYADFDQDTLERDTSSKGSFSGIDEWRSYNRARVHAYEARSAEAHNTLWE